MDCALHRLGVTVVLDRAGVTGEDGPSHHGMWDMSLAAIVPGLRMAAPRDALTLAEELHEALDITDGPTVLRFPKGAVPATIPAVRRVVADPGSGPGSGVDVLAEPAVGAGADRDVLLVAVGAFGAMAVEAARLLAAQGIGVTVVDPRWALPVPAEIATLAAEHRLVVTVEDGGRSGGVGAAVADRLSGTGIGVHVLALPQRFLEPASRGELLAELGLTGQAVARGITELIARRSNEPDRTGEPAGQQ
jgi:1-deoxy-D-xylulose-5-phosphate synthase